MQDTTVKLGGSFPDDELRRAMQQLVRFGRLLESHDRSGANASLSEVMALGELAEVESMSQQELGRLLGLEKSTVSRLVTGLVQRGWVVRQRNPDNRRLYRLELTDEGRVVAGRVGDHLQVQHAALLGALTPTERDALTAGLAGLVRVLQAHPRGLVS